MSGPEQAARVAIACQGGGSHTAFTAGVLQGLLERKVDGWEIVALSGTAGGAICALLAWDGLLRDDRPRALNQLQKFWRESATSSLLDAFLNHSVQMAIHLRSLVPLPEISPYAYPSWSQQQLRRMLEHRVDFAEVRSLASREGVPELLIGAVDVMNGAFEVFRGPRISVDAVLASAAIPDLFPAVALDGRFFWDGLSCQNPPIRELTDSRIDELWVIQINPSQCDRLPTTVDDIRDRRNELAGDLSLGQELRFIETINSLLRRGLLVHSSYRPITVRRIVLDRDLDYAAKFDRSESSIRGLMTLGRDRAQRFLAERRAGPSDATADHRPPPIPVARSS